MGERYAQELPSGIDLNNPIGADSEEKKRKFHIIPPTDNQQQTAWDTDSRWKEYHYSDDTHANYDNAFCGLKDLKMTWRGRSTL